jgi:hypothetical protein
MEEIRNAVESMDKKNAPEEDGLLAKFMNKPLKLFPDL